LLRSIRTACALLLLLAAATSVFRAIEAQSDNRPGRGAAPAATDQQAILLLITVAANGSARHQPSLAATNGATKKWAHTLRTPRNYRAYRYSRCSGRDFFRWWNSREDVERWEKASMARWSIKAHGIPGYRPDPYAIPPMPEGAPTTKPSAEDARAFPDPHGGINIRTKSRSTQAAL